VRETLAAARQRYPGRRLIAVLEPRNYTSQTRAFQERFRQAFGQADRVILAALFRPERYDEHTAMNPAELVEGLRSDGVRADYIPAVDDIVADLASTAESRDVVILMSNGGFGGIHGKLLEALHRRGPRAGGPGPTSA
jgi:UDP-N-acetylmuramate: L-alanyl-gamma-D-glutamyl-meso-diaminopimelate ligase